LNGVLEASMKKLDTVFNEKKKENEEFQQKIQKQEEELKELVEGQVKTNDAIDNFVETQTELTTLREEIFKNNKIILDLESQIRILEQNKKIADAIFGAQEVVFQATLAQKNQLARKIGSMS
jgi:DNA repair exonuclease SbcCD ATPase subunit